MVPLDENLKEDCWRSNYHVAQQEVLDRALSLAQEGDDLIQKSHYAEDSIQPKCTEIRAVREDVSSSLRAKKDHLLKAMELHHCLERVRRNTHTPYTRLLCCIFKK